MRVRPEPPGEALVLRAAGWQRPGEVPEGDRAAARVAAEEAARLAQPAAAVRWLRTDDSVWWPRLANGSPGGVGRCAAVALTLGPALEEKVTERFASGRLAAGVWLEAAGNALLAQSTAGVRALLLRELSGERPVGDGRTEDAPVLLWVAPGCHGLPVERLAEVGAAAGGEAAGVVARPGGGLAPGKSVVGLFVRPAENAAGERLRRRFARDCAGCATRWCPGRAGGAEGEGQR